MLFGKKTSEPELKVEWVTNMPGLVETYPMIPARSLTPDWYKTSKNKIDARTQSPTHVPPPPKNPNGAPGGYPIGTPHGAKPEQTNEVKMPERIKDRLPTIRACPGVIDVMRAGWVLRAWTDFEIVTPEPPKGTDDDRYLHESGVRGENGTVGNFSAALNQNLPLWPGEYGFALKFDSPWTCKLPPGWSLMYAPIPFAAPTPWRVVPGIVDCDIFHVVNLVATWNHHGAYVIEAGTPLCTLIPVRRDGFHMDGESIYDPERHTLLKSMGKGAPGHGANRLIHGSYLKLRMKRQRGIE